MEVANMAPVSKAAAPAKVSGAKGAALAVVFLKDAEKEGQEAAKKAESRKDKLAKIISLPERADHLAFRKALEEKRAEITAEAAAVEMTLTKYLEGNTAAASVQVTVSLWLKLSRAVESGWKPEMSQPWGSISVSATDFLSAAAAPKAPSKPGEPVQVQNVSPTRRGRPSKDAAEKAAPVQTRVVELMKEAGIQAEAGKPVPNRNLAAIVASVIYNATTAELDAVQKVLTAEMERAKAREAAKNTADAVLAQAKARGAKGETLKPGEPIQNQSDKATANDGKGKHKGRKAHA